MIDNSIIRVRQNGACVARDSELVVGEGFEMPLGRIGHKPLIVAAFQKPYRSQIVQSLWRKIRSPGLKSSFLQLSGFSARQKVWQIAGFSTVFSALWNECRNKLAERRGFELPVRKPIRATILPRMDWLSYVIGALLWWLGATFVAPGFGPAG
jgi:hypothetical protein